MYQSGIFDLKYDFKELQVVPFDKVYTRKKLFLLSHNNVRKLHKRSMSNSAFSKEKRRITVIEKLKLFSSSQKQKNKKSSKVDPNILERSREFDTK